MAEKKKKDDRCTRIAKRKYDVWPSAYASGAVVQCRKGKIWKGLKEQELNDLITRIVTDSLSQLAEKTDYSKEKESGLHGWFSRQGGKGSSSGWVDCNTCRTDKKTGRKKCKACGREKGEKRSKYPSCRPTPSACGTKGKGKKWGKKSESKMKINKEELKEIILEEIHNALCEERYDQHVIEEAEYKGKKVTLNDPIRTSGESKKFKVYVKNEKGNVVMVRFGDPNMEIKRDDPKRRKSFRARHNCSDPGPKWKARYWSCWQWRAGAKVDN